MDHEGLASDFMIDKAVDSIFKNFMMRTAVLEELVDAGERLLRGFYRELEMIARAPLLLSEVIDDVIKANYTDKLKDYVESGFSTHGNAVRSIGNLHLCRGGLEEHLNKAKAVLDELESLKNNVTGITIQAVDEYFSNFGFKHSEDAKTQQSCSIQEDAQECMLPDESLLRTTLMTIIYGMLKREFTMQEKIVKSLDQKPTSSMLESYCLFWELRPDVNENVINQAWKCVSR